MSDFAQAGLICTLQRLNDSHLALIEAELIEISRFRPLALVLPCHGSDLDRPAFRHIIEELHDATFLSEVVLSMNGVDAAGVEAARNLFTTVPTRLTVLSNDCVPPASGKGGNVAAAFRHLLQEGNCEILATQDCDVASFRRRDLARLCYAVCHPELAYHFAKMYYSRVTDRLYGRVSRLFLAPLLQAMLRVAGHQPLLDFLLSFRYPLAGECALTREVAAKLPAVSGWGLEIGQLCEVFRMLDPRQICQVEGGSGYDHKHQPAATALAVMASEIAAELFRQCASEGIPSDAGFRAAVADAYRREAVFALARSASLARINQLPLDVENEREIVEHFTICLADRSPARDAHSHDVKREKTRSF